MGIVDKLLKTENQIRRRIENIFGGGAIRTPLEVRREILEQVESRISVDKGGKVFPFGRIQICLKPTDPALQDVLQAAFLRDRSLENDIRELLRESGASFPHTLEVTLDLVKTGDGESKAGDPVLSIQFCGMEDVTAHERPAATLVVVKGTAEKSSYAMEKDRMLIGRLAELMDRGGLMARRNDVVFLDNDDEINSSIGRAHATICYDRTRNEYRIIDEVSRYGTRIFREGRTIEVPGGNPRGIRLRSGDEIYLGLGCLRFEIAPE
jgi:hypothetical protein